MAQGWHLGHHQAQCEPSCSGIQHQPHDPAARGGHQSHQGGGHPSAISLWPNPSVTAGTQRSQVVRAQHVGEVANKTAVAAGKQWLLLSFPCWIWKLNGWSLCDKWPWRPWLSQHLWCRWGEQSHTKSSLNLLVLFVFSSYFINRFGLRLLFSLSFKIVVFF